MSAGVWETPKVTLVGGGGGSERPGESVVFAGAAGGSRSLRTSFSSGQSSKRCCEVRIPPHMQFSASSFGNESDGDWRRNKARRVAGLDCRSPLGNVVDGRMGVEGSGGCLLDQSILGCCL